MGILDKQVYLYSVDTSYFYTKEEKAIHNKLNQLYFKKDKTDDDKEQIKHLKQQLYDLLKTNTQMRELDYTMLKPKNIVGLFESTLTRTLGIKTDELTEYLFIVQTYYFDVLKDLIHNGFYYKGEKYVCFTASAGQIRTKKTVFIKEDLLNRYELTLMCGLTKDEINRRGGVNINKYLAYLALCNSATDWWQGFNIDKAIVVDDMETLVTAEVDYIDEKTWTIERKVMGIPITHTDGCGMILPSVSKKNFMIRLPWIKGLLVSFPFDKFIREHQRKTGEYKGIVKDIYGVEHDILKEDIQIIFTKSQFKMWKYYDSWEQYKQYFKKYDCQAGITNVEEDVFEDAKINYQMLQSITDITDEELQQLADKTIQRIKKVGTDKNTMLKILGVTKGNKNKTYLQKSLEIYPELLHASFCKEIIKAVKRKLVKEAKAGKLEIQGKYTFISPDLYAFCEYLFLGNKQPQGLLKNGEVYCKLYKDVEELDCLRSPHLYREHAIRKNVVDAEKSKWFKTNALYTSCHDIISKMLQFDNDGDKSLVCADKTLVDVVKRNMGRG